MANERYQTILADPPWAYGAPGKFGKTLEHRPNRDKGESRHGAGSQARYGSERHSTAHPRAEGGLRC